MPGFAIAPEGTHVGDVGEMVVLVAFESDVDCAESEEEGSGTGLREEKNGN